jgi:nucleotide-binding universal stress UspA family protein
MYKAILAAVDGSADGEQVAATAGELAAMCGSRLILAFIADPGAACDDLGKLAQTEHVGSGAPSTLHPNIAQVPGWLDDAFGKVEGAASMREVLETLGAQVLDRAEVLANEKGAENVSRVIEDGDPASHLLDIADRENADLIVVGSRGLGRLRELLIGSVSHKVAMLAKCPCLIVR